MTFFPSSQLFPSRKIGKCVPTLQKGRWPVLESTKIYFPHMLNGKTPCGQRTTRYLPTYSFLYSSELSPRHTLTVCQQNFTQPDRVGRLGCRKNTCVPIQWRWDVLMEFTVGRAVKVATGWWGKTTKSLPVRPTVWGGWDEKRDINRCKSLLPSLGMANGTH